MIFYRHKEGGMVRPGIGFLRTHGLFDVLFAVPSGRGGLLWGKITFSGRFVRWCLSLNFMRDHKMYRPVDVDNVKYFICRRCGESTYDNCADQCGGWLFQRRGGFTFRRVAEPLA